MSLKKMFSDFDIVYVMVFFIVTVVVFLAYLLSSKNPKRPRRVKIVHSGVPGLRRGAGWTRNVLRDDRDDRELDDSTERPGPITTPSATPPAPPPAAFSLMNN